MTNNAEDRLTHLLRPLAARIDSLSQKISIGKNDKQKSLNVAEVREELDRLSGFVGHAAQINGGGLTGGDTTVLTLGAAAQRIARFSKGGVALPGAAKSTESATFIVDYAIFDIFALQMLAFLRDSAESASLKLAKGDEKLSIEFEINNPSFNYSELDSIWTNEGASAASLRIGQAENSSLHHLNLAQQAVGLMGGQLIVQSDGRCSIGFSVPECKQMELGLFSEGAQQHVDHLSPDDEELYGRVR